jgi:glycosyltransferase involved in cell wall biosynthesis
MNLLLYNPVLNSSQYAGLGFFYKDVLETWLVDNRKLFFSIKILKTGDSDFCFEDELKAEYIVIPTFSNLVYRVLYEQFVLPFRLLSLKIDILLSPGPAFPVLLAFLKPRTKYVTTIHDLIPFFVSDKYEFKRNLYIKSITWLSSLLSDKVLAVSQTTKRDLVSYFGIDENKVDVVYNVVNRAPSSSGERGHYFLSVCTIEPGKNLETAILGFNEFKKRSAVNYVYYIVGKYGWQSEGLFELVKKLNLVDEVIFMGYVSEQEKFEMFASCVCLINLSKYEGFPSLREVVGENGLFQDPLDIDQLVLNLEKVVDLQDLELETVTEYVRKFNLSSVHWQLRTALNL